MLPETGAICHLTIQGHNQLIDKLGFQLRQNTRLFIGRTSLFITNNCLL